MSAEWTQSALFQTAALPRKNAAGGLAFVCLMTLLLVLSP